ncbi:MAG: SLATT domain-containing protein [Bacteroidetes bacterium]|nr:SLATT domain-containing protein [Bacteroidota bacterium]
MEDLKPSNFGSPRKMKSIWTPEETTIALEELYTYVTGKASEAINWYYVKRNPKRIVGLTLRYCSIVFIALAGIIPILVTMYPKCNYNPGWAAIAVALAGLMIAIDKFGGFTSGWIRYVVAAQKLNQALEEFRFTWESDKHRLAGSAISPDEIKTLVNNCKEFLEKAQTIVSDETQKWVGEFQSALKDIEASAKVAEDAAKSTVKAKEDGAIALTVTNGSSCNGPWVVYLNGSKTGDYTGNNAALSHIKPGIVVIKVTGSIPPKSVQAEQPVTVKGGEIATLSLTLS